MPAIAFRLDVAPDADLQSIVGPTGWDITYASGDTLITWESTDAAFDLLPGGAAIFAVSSKIAPQLTDYAALGYDGNSFSSQQGQIQGPGVAAIPEPSALALYTIGLAGLLGLTRRARPDLP